MQDSYPNEKSLDGRDVESIGKELGCNHKTILKYLKLYNIPRRGTTCGWKYWGNYHGGGGRKKGTKLSEAHKEKLRNSIHKHHIDTNRNNNSSTMVYNSNNPTLKKELR